MNNTFARIGAAIAIALLIVFALKPGEKPRQRGWWGGYEFDTTARGKLNNRFYLSRRAAFEYQAAEERAMARELANAATPPAASTLSFRFSPDLPAKVRTAIETTVRAELGALGLESPRHPVVVIAASDPATKAPRYRRAVVLPERADGPCTVVLHIPPRQFGYFRTSSMDRTLGSCAFHAAYGAPGAGMHEWLRETKLERAAYLTAPASVAEDTAMLKTRSYFTANIPLRGCRAGRPVLCDVHFSASDTVFARLDRMFFDEFATMSTEVNGLLPDVVMFEPSMTSERSRITQGLLAELATSLGQDRFGTIWRGDGPTRGFERAEGRPLWEWTHELMVKRVLPDDIGSGLTLGSALLTLLVAGGVFVLTLKTAPRRID
ncbi:MAG: hypothetical protein IT357_07450 [Gemmatimonadaceae bacterium]|nr:hypothetical protein [Gemmatimonadaceae bacterium]